MSRQSLGEIAASYGQTTRFGHRDYQVAKEQGYSDNDIRNYFNQNPGNVGQNLLNEFNSGNVDLSKAVQTTPTQYSAQQAASGGGGMTPAAFNFQSQMQLQQLIGTQNMALQRLRNEGSALLGRLEAGASMYGSDQDTLQQKIASEASERASKYASFQDRMKGENVAQIKGTSDTAIAKIDSAGRQAAAEIMGSWNAQNTAVEGAYRNENAKIAGQYQKDVAKLNKESNIFSSMMSGFW